MEGIQGAILRVKLRHLEAWTEARRATRAPYDALLAGRERRSRPSSCADRRHVYHVYAVRTADRDGLQRRCRPTAIRPACTIRFRFTCSRRTPISATQRGDFPQSERAAREVLSLPMYPGADADAGRAGRDRRPAGGHVG